MMAGYLGQQAIDTSPVVDGWFDTGDLASFGPAGEILLMGASRT